MIKLTDLLFEGITYTKWIQPTLDELRQEYKVEHEKKGLGLFKTFNDFKKAVDNAKMESISKSADSKISNRSNTRSFDELLDLIKGYASYPKYRNEDTLKNLYSRFKTNKPMTMPMVLEYKNKSRRIFAGNTRMDIAFQLGITPKVLILLV